jgi:hypothetical protein
MKTNNKYTKWSQVPVGTKFKVVSNSNSHNYPLNELLTVVSRNSTSSCAHVTGNPIHNTLMIKDCLFVNFDLATMKDVIVQKQEALLKIQEEIIEVENCIKFCEEQGLEEYDEDLHKVMKTLDTLESKKLTKLEKAKMIAKLISN